MGIFDGVPSGLSGLINAGIGLLKADAYSLVSGLFGTPSWGIFFYGIPVVVADSVASFDLTKNWNLSTFPIEGGSFVSYNKVYQPFHGTFRFVSGGSELNRQLLLSSIDAISGDTNVYDIVTPEMVYSGVNVSGYSLKRSGQSGLGMITIDVKVEQVKQVYGLSFASTVAPEAASQTNGGPVQSLPHPQSEPGVSAILPLDPISVSTLPGQ